MPTNGNIVKIVTIAVIVLTLCVTALILPKRWLRPNPVPEGKVLVDQTFLDSLKAVAEMSPDTVWDVKIIVSEVPKYIVKTKPEPYFIDLPTGGRTYIDSLQMIEDGINAWVKIKAQGVVDQIVWGYTPVYKTITKEIRIPEPYPVEVLQEVPQRGLFAYGGAGGGIGEAGFSFGLLWQQRNGVFYGAEMIQFKNRYYMLKLGYKIL